jgi:hypothetical protein
MKRLVSMRESLADPQLLGAALKGESWAIWRAFLIALAGEELTDEERALYKGITGRDREPGEMVDVALCVAGWRSGKTTAMAAFITWLATRGRAGRFVDTEPEARPQAY